MCACEGPIMSVDALLEVRNLKRYFPIRGGLLQREVATVQAVGDILFGGRRGGAPGIVGGSGGGEAATGGPLLQLLRPHPGAIALSGRTRGIVRRLGGRRLR